MGRHEIVVTTIQNTGDVMVRQSLELSLSQIKIVIDLKHKNLMDLDNQITQAEPNIEALDIHVHEKSLSKCDIITGDRPTPIYLLSTVVGDMPNQPIL